MLDDYFSYPLLTFQFNITTVIANCKATLKQLVETRLYTVLKTFTVSQTTHGEHDLIDPS